MVIRWMGHGFGGRSIGVSVQLGTQEVGSGRTSLPPSRHRTAITASSAAEKTGEQFRRSWIVMRPGVVRVIGHQKEWGGLCKRLQGWGCAHGRVISTGISCQHKRCTVLMLKADTARPAKGHGGHPHLPEEKIGTAGRRWKLSVEQSTNTAPSATSSVRPSWKIRQLRSTRRTRPIRTVFLRTRRKMRSSSLDRLAEGGQSSETEEIREWPIGGEVLHGAGGTGQRRKAGPAWGICS